MFKVTIIKRIKRSARLSVKDSQNVILSVPKNYTKAHCKQIIEQNRVWIESQIEKFQQQEAHFHSLRQNAQILYFGQWRKKEEFANPAKELKSALENFLHNECENLAKLMGVEFGKLKTKKAKSYFGLCTHKNDLSFSLMLCFAPKECVRYVVVHELAHITHKNHSKAFWNLVGTFCADYKLLRASLRQNASLYKNLLQEIFT
ncbi:M48 family metallopeptidase [Helicobacter himalayensis]|uniref:M48 family metallopeptidase n=1 Tax=Helicobacter himalayensis TaxID=1591088 RepID=UPI0008325EB8|nr:YgjP-like metallopeptidase domain-containing protein [Helicobacter himalayensis]